jgi:hypothetical protein
VMAPYENQLLGAFVYALGYHGGRASAPGAAVNLFQQTPLDQSFGDLIVGSSHCLALEFKRDKGLLADERRKWTEGAFATACLDAGMKRVALQAHFVVYPESMPGGLQLWCALYAKYMLGARAELPVYPMDALVRAIHAGPQAAKGPLGVPPADLEHYLRSLKEFRRKGSTGRSSGEEAWVAVAQKQGKLQIVTASSLTQLLEPKREYAPELERPSPSRDRGYDFGM